MKNENHSGWWGGRGSGAVVRQSKARRSSRREAPYGTPGLARDSALPELITKLMLPGNLHLFLLVCSLRRER